MNSATGRLIEWKKAAPKYESRSFTIDLDWDTRCEVVLRSGDRIARDQSDDLDDAVEKALALWEQEEQEAGLDSKDNFRWAVADGRLYKKGDDCP